MLGLWARSYWKYDQISLEIGGEPATLCDLLDGNVIVYHLDSKVLPASTKRTFHWTIFEKQNSIPWQFELLLKATRPRRYHFGSLGICIDELMTEYGDGTRTIIYARHWMFAVLFSVWPLLFFIKLAKRRNRTVNGCCVRCGYDLRARPDRCPECGTVSNRP